MGYWEFGLKSFVFEEWVYGSDLWCFPFLFLLIA